MKTNIKSKLFAIMMILSYISNAQFLKVKAHFVDKTGRKVSANYVLSSGKTIVATGDSKKLCTKLPFNQNYVLKIEKPGYITKIVHFSTFTKALEEFVFDFDAILSPKKLTAYKIDTTEKKQFLVYYSHTKKNFDYKSSNLKTTQ